MTPTTVLLLPIIAHAVFSQYHPLSSDYIAWINHGQSQWKAGKNFEKNEWPRVKNMASGTWRTPVPSHHQTPTSDSLDIPESFDSRQAWPLCRSVWLIWDQSHCGSCWATSAAAAMSDRICIHSGQQLQVLVSAQDLLSCCWQCGRGCLGGEIPWAWWYWQNYGIVTGGMYNSTQGCKAYSLPPCEHHVRLQTRPHCDDLRLQTPSCKKQCDNINEKYQSQLTYGNRVRQFIGVKEIQREIMTNGPVEGAIDVFEDFFSYKSGVYSKMGGKYIGGHAIKILGWGEENSTPYWLCANSWNNDWGDGGYFKIVRGDNHCGIEDNVFASKPVF